MTSHKTAPTLDDVARLAGVSRATVSRAIRGGERVSQTALTAIEAAVERLGYVPNQAARQLASRRSNTIAVVASEPHRRVFHDPFFAISVAAVAERLESTDQHMALHVSYGGFCRKLEEHLLGRHVDGTIVISHRDAEKLPAFLERVGRPCVFLGRPTSGAERPDGFSVAHRYVDIDNVLGGRVVGDHLVQRGCRRIAVISGDLDTASARDRLAGLKAALATHGLEPVAVHPGNYHPASGRTQALELLASGVAFDGLFVGSDHMAVAALGVLNEAGIRVPEDVKLVGFDDAEISRLTTPTLTTMTNPWAELARIATERLLTELHGEPMIEPLILEPQLIARRSTDQA